MKFHIEEVLSTIFLHFFLKDLEKWQFLSKYSSLTCISISSFERILQFPFLAAVKRIFVELLLCLFSHHLTY